MDQNSIVTTSEIFDRCWKVTPRIGIPTGEVVIEKKVEGKKKTEVRIQVLPTSCFSKYKQEARRLCISAGTSFDRGFLIPDTRIEALTEKLTGIGKDFLAGVPDFLRQWNDAVVSRAKEETDDEIKAKIQLAGAAKASEMQNGLYFRVGKFKILPDDVGGELDDLAFEVKGLAGQIAYEIAEDVKTSWGGGATQRIRGTIARVKTKVEGLAFINPKFRELLGTIDKVVAQLPPAGQIEGEPYFLLIGLMDVLSKPERILGDHTLSIPEEEQLRQAQASQQQLLVSSDLATIPEDPAPFSMTVEDGAIPTDDFIDAVPAIEVPTDSLLF